MKHSDPEILLKHNNIRATRKKVAVLREILNSKNPVHARELHEYISARIRIDLATVYRTLTLLKEKEVIREINDSTGIQYFEIACIHNPVHPHFRCSQCSKMVCLRFLNRDETEYVSGFAGDCEIRDISIVLTGICTQCREENR